MQRVLNISNEFETFETCFEYSQRVWNSNVFWIFAHVWNISNVFWIFATRLKDLKYVLNISNSFETFETCFEYSQRVWNISKVFFFFFFNSGLLSMPNHYIFSQLDCARYCIGSSSHARWPRNCPWRVPAWCVQMMGVTGLPIVKKETCKALSASFDMAKNAISTAYYLLSLPTITHYIHLPYPFTIIYITGRLAHCTLTLVTLRNPQNLPRESRHSIVVRASVWGAGGRGSNPGPTASHQRRRQRRKQWEVCASQLGAWH